MGNEDIKNLFVKRDKTKTSTGYEDSWGNPVHHYESLIVLALKENPHMALTNGDKWLMWNPSNSHWVVFLKKWNSKRAKVMISTPNEADAIKALLE